MMMRFICEMASVETAVHLLMLYMDIQAALAGHPVCCKTHRALLKVASRVTSKM